jgi:dolichol-phosphate mannosyltransferase
MNPQIGILIPLYNEKENLPRLISELNRLVETRRDIHFEVVLIDDGSSDGSFEDPKLKPSMRFRGRILRLAKNYGTHIALRAGLTYTQAAYSVNLYADLQDPPELVPDLHARAREGFDIVWGIRKKIGEKITKTLPSRIYSWMMRCLVSRDFPKNDCDIVLFNEKVRKELHQIPVLNRSIFLDVWTLGLRQSQVLYDKKARLYGKSKWTLAKKIKLFTDSLFGYSHAPLQAIGIFGFVFMVISLLTPWFRCCGCLRRPGCGTVISLVTTGFLLTFASLWILGQYLVRCWDACKGNRPYLVDSVEEI